MGRAFPGHASSWRGLLLVAGIATIYMDVAPPIARADHLKPNRVAAGTPEHVLAGVNVYGDTIERVITRLGKPNKVESTTTSDYPTGSGERSYEWEKGGIRLRVGTDFRTDARSHQVNESAPIAVDVWGERRSSRYGKTGQGLSLGADVPTIRRIYGSRFVRNRHSVTIQWSDQTTLTIDLSVTGRVVHMQLAASQE